MGKDLISNGGFEDFTGTADNHLGSEVLTNGDFEAVSDGTDLALNGGFETAGGGDSDIWADWFESASDGALANTQEGAEVHGGEDAAKITAGPTKDTYVVQNITVVPGTTIKWSFWTRGDGTNAGRYALYDNSNSEDIVPCTSTEVTGTTYTEVTSTVNIPTGCTSLIFYFYCPDADGGIAYFDDFTFKQQDVDGWTKTGMTEGSAGRTAPRNGTGHAVVVDDGAGTEYIYQPSVTVVANTPYKAVGNVRAATGTVDVKMAVSLLADATFDDGVNLVASAAQGTTYSLLTKYLKTGTDTAGAFSLSWIAANDTGTAFWDDASLKPIEWDTFTSWTNSATDEHGSYIDADTANKSAGSYCAEIFKGPTASTDISTYFTLSAMKGASYKVTAKGMSDGTGTGKVYADSDNTGGGEVATGDSSMTSKAFTFACGMAARKLYLTSATAGGSVFWDEVSCKMKAKRASSMGPSRGRMI